MLQATYVHLGESIDHVLSADLTAGDVVAISERVLIARKDTAGGQPGALADLWKRGWPKVPTVAHVG